MTYAQEVAKRLAGIIEVPLYPVWSYSRRNEKSVIHVGVATCPVCALSKKIRQGDPTTWRCECQRVFQLRVTFHDDQQDREE